jgi:ribosomal protein S10
MCLHGKIISMQNKLAKQIWKIKLISSDASLLETTIRNIRDVATVAMMNFTVIPLPCHRSGVINVKRSCFTPGRSVNQYVFLEMKRAIFLDFFESKNESPINLLRDTKIPPGVIIKLKKHKG